mgnify:CR=1 FL=1
MTDLLDKPTDPAEFFDALNKALDEGATIKVDDMTDAFRLALELDLREDWTVVTDWVASVELTHGGRTFRFEAR